MKESSSFGISVSVLSFSTHPTSKLKAFFSNFSALNLCASLTYTVGVVRHEFTRLAHEFGLDQPKQPIYETLSLSIPNRQNHNSNRIRQRLIETLPTSLVLVKLKRTPRATTTLLYLTRRPWRTTVPFRCQALHPRRVMEPSHNRRQQRPRSVLSSHASRHRSGRDSPNGVRGTNSLIGVPWPDPRI